MKKIISMMILTLVIASTAVAATKSRSKEIKLPGGGVISTTGTGPYNPNGN